MLVLPRKWVSAGGNARLWGAGGTYKWVPYDALPPVGALDGSFDWLGAQDEAEGLGLDPPNNVSLEELTAREQEAMEGGLRLPAPFVRFMQDEDLHARLPSPTACYLELGARLVAIPNHDGPERLLRFMNDQQVCYLWYLLLEPDGKHRVVVARPKWLDKRGSSLEDITIINDVTECASSFEELIKRMWIENTLWYANVNKLPVTGELAAYEEAASKAVASGDVGGRP
jgi:hypothetical protein